MGSHELQASPGLATLGGHRINWAAGHRRVRSLPRRIVQAIRAGAWRKVKRLSYLLVHSFAGRALAVTRVTENAGQRTPGGDGEVWDTPDRKARAVESMDHWRCYRPRPLTRVYIPQPNGKRRPLGIPAMLDRARQALYLQALQPIAETTGDPHSSGFRPKRQGADAMAQCFKVLRPKTAAPWIWEGDLQGFFDNMSCGWIEEPSPRNKRVLSKWLRSGFSDQGALFPTTAGVPHGGIGSPVMSTMVLDGLEQVGQGGAWRRRVHNINDVRWAEDGIITANSREV